MIREFNTNDLNEVMTIWLDTNISTHNYIKKEYWKENYDRVREAILEADVLIYEEDGHILAFVGIIENYIAGIFVKENIQCHRIGKKLIDECKNRNTELTLNVYEKNERAIKFYLREKFKIIEKSIDKETGESELLMKWGNDE